MHCVPSATKRRDTRIAITRYGAAGLFDHPTGQSYTIQAVASPPSALWVHPRHVPFNDTCAGSFNSGSALGASLPRRSHYGALRRHPQTTWIMPSNGPSRRSARLKWQPAPPPPSPPLAAPPKKRAKRRHIRSSEDVEQGGILRNMPLDIIYEVCA